MLSAMALPGITNRDPLLGDAREGSPKRRVALDLLEATLAAVTPASVMGATLQRLRDQGIALEDCHLLAVGKAAVGMTQAVLGEIPVASGLVVGLESGDCGPCAVLIGGHPVPAKDAEKTGRRVLDWACQRRAGETVLCLLSGGGSAMLELPIEGVTMEDVRRTTQLLMDAGAPISELNAVRRRLSQIKGGKLASALHPASIVNAVLSDVPGHGLELVCSGPTCPAPPDDEFRLRRALGRGLALPATVQTRLEEAPPGHPTLRDVRIVSEVVADNRTALRSLVESGRKSGLNLAVHPETLVGEARDSGVNFYKEAWALLQSKPGLDGVVCGGEPTVHVQGDGIGGRMQEWVLGARAAYQGGLLVGLATDGRDGPSRHAGGLLDEATLARARGSTMDATQCLTRNNSSAWFEHANSVITTGPTGTNVADIGLLLR